MLQQLIINADDYGLTKAVSDAIIEVYQNGSLSSTTFMVTMPGTEYAAALALKNPGLGVGLHVNLTEGKSLSKDNRLTNADGYFAGRKSVLKKMLLAQAPSQDIEKELTAQYERCRALGITPTHLDSHQHVHMLPRVFPVFAQFARTKNIPLRVTYPQIIVRKGGKINTSKMAKQLMLDLMVKNALRHTPGLKHNNSFNSIFDLHPYRPPKPDDFIHLLNVAHGPVHELMLHPFIMSDEMRAAYPNADFYKMKEGFFVKAVYEYEGLKNFSIRQWLELNMPDVKMIHYGQLA